MKKNQFIILIIAVLASLILTIFLVRYNKAKSVEGGSGNVMSELVWPLADYDGWWYIDEQSHDGVSMIEIFYLDSKSEQYTVYREAGFPVAKLNAREGNTGELILDLELFGEVSMFLLDSDTLKCEDGMTFHRGEPLSQPNYSLFAGIWYENGNVNGNYYTLSNNGSYEYYDVLINANTKNEKEIKTGTYTFSVITRYFGENGSFKSLCLTMDDGSMLKDDFYLSQNGEGLMDSGFDKDFYIRSDVIGTTSADETILLCNLVLTRPWHGDGGNYLFFTEDGKFKLSAVDEEGTINSYDEGTWSSNGDELHLVWKNGEKEIASYRVKDGISVPSLKETFTDK